MKLYSVIARGILKGLEEEFVILLHSEILQLKFWYNWPSGRCLILNIRSRNHQQSVNQCCFLFSVNGFVICVSKMLYNLIGAVMDSRQGRFDVTLHFRVSSLVPPPS